jgi:Fimbrial protein
MVVTGFMLWSTGAQAGTITFNSPPSVVMSPSYQVDAGAANGAGVFQQSVSLSLSFSGVTCPVTRTMTINGSRTTAASTRFKTNIPGIAVGYYTGNSWTGGTPTYSSSPRVESLGSHADGPATMSVTTSLQVWDGPVGGGRLTDIPSLTIAFSGTCIPTVSQTIQYVSGALINSTGTCSVDAGARNVPVALPRAIVSAFSGIGSITGTTDFNITLNCQPGAIVDMTLTDATDPANRSSVLTPSTMSASQGVGFQILRNGLPVSFGPDSSAVGTPNQWRVGTPTTGGNYAIPLRVSYVQTQSKIMPGSISGVATFTASYE